jgi:YeeE/YedE family (DUF395).
MNMSEKAPSRPWNPYVAGALAGLLLIVSVWTTGKYFGASTTYVRSTGMVEQVIVPDHVEGNAYFGKEKPLIDWQWMFVAGIVVGSLGAAAASRTFKVQAVPDRWRDRFGPAPRLRHVAAFIGGIVAMFGARLADGCPSGHGLSGSLQLALSGYVALICFFVGGLVVARLLYGGRH